MPQATRTPKATADQQPAPATKALAQPDNRPGTVQAKALLASMERPPHQVAQRQVMGAIADSPRQVAQRAAQLQAPQPNRTGLPDALKTGVENLSGHSLDEVRVRYNSAKPAQLQAHAYAQGAEIHVAPGQEKHLPHEAWHVVQQKQGRVRPTMQLKGVGVNDDSSLEKEADVMGNRAFTLHGQPGEERQVKETDDKAAQAVVLQRVDSSDESSSEEAPPRRTARRVAQSSSRSRGGRRNPTAGQQARRPGRTTESQARGSIEGTESQARRRRTRSWSAEDEPPTSMRRVESVASEHGTQIEPQPGEPPGEHGLTAAEFEQINQARTHRFPSGRADRRPVGNPPHSPVRLSLYGEGSASFRDLACWNWALTGGCENPVNPSYLFQMLGDMVHNPEEPLYQRSFGATWRAMRPTAEATMAPEGVRVREHEIAVYQRHQEEIQALWNRRRQVGANRGDNVERITNDAVRLSMRMNNLQPAEDGEQAPFSIAMARHPDQGVNWSHWGLETSQRDENRHSFETIPGWGLWHQREGFDYWAQQTASIEDSQVTRVPLRHLAPGHVTGIRGQLGIMNTGRSSRPTTLTSGSRRRAETGRGRGRGRGSSTQTAREGAAQEAVAVVAPGHQLNAGGMVLHYHGILGWANAQGTYSPEFHFVMTNPGHAAALLQQGGMAPGDTHLFTQQFNAAVLQAGQQGVEYVEAHLQEQIMQTLGTNQEQLLAIIRYLRRPQEQREMHPTQ